MQRMYSNENPPKSAPWRSFLSLSRYATRVIQDDTPIISDGDETKTVFFEPSCGGYVIEYDVVSLPN